MRFSILATLFGIGSLVMALAIVFLYGMDGSVTPDTPAEHGRRLFRLQGCASCHAVGGGMSRGPDLAALVPRLSTRLQDEVYRDHLDSLRTARPQLYGRFEDRYDRIFSAQGDDRMREWFAQHLINPRFDHFTGLMPTYNHLTEQQVTYLTAYIMTLR